MFNLGDTTNESNEDHALLNLIKEQDSDNFIDKIYFYDKDLNEPKYQFLIKRFEDAGIKHLNDSKAITEYSQCMDGVNNNIDDYNPSRKRKILILFGDMIAEFISNNKCQEMVKEVFIRCRKLDI